MWWLIIEPRSLRRSLPLIDELAVPRGGWWGKRAEKPGYALEASGRVELADVESLELRPGGANGKWIGASGSPARCSSR